MATKQEIAESLTVNDLREFAEGEGIDLAGATVKGDIVARVVAGSSAAALNAYAFEEEEEMAEVLTPQEQAEQGVSAADLEITQAPTGESRIVKANPEAPTQAQLDAALVETSGPAPLTVTVDGDEVELRPDDAARLASQQEPKHEGNAQEGYWSNPALIDWQTNPDAVQANEEAYAARVVPAE